MDIPLGSFYKKETESQKNCSISIALGHKKLLFGDGK